METKRKSFVLSADDLKAWQKYADKFHKGNLTAAISYVMNLHVKKPRKK